MLPPSNKDDICFNIHPNLTGIFVSIIRNGLKAKYMSAVPYYYFDSESTLDMQEGMDTDKTLG